MIKVMMVIVLVCKWYYHCVDGKDSGRGDGDLL